MANIVEVSKESNKNLLCAEGLYINLGITKNYEDSGSCSYDREYMLYPYSSDLPDDLTINKRNTVKVRVRSVTNPVKDRFDKIPYKQYGRSEIDGVTLIMLRRDYPKERVVPTK